jgi:hypothetical protein
MAMSASSKMATLWVGSLLLLGCASSQANETAAHERRHELVALRSGDGVLPGVAVTLLRADGTRVSLGETNGLGRIAVDLPTESANEALLLFCKEGYYCGALELSRERLDAYQEHSIALAPVVFL